MGVVLWTGSLRLLPGGAQWQGNPYFCSKQDCDRQKRGDSFERPPVASPSVGKRSFCPAGSNPTGKSLQSERPVPDGARRKSL